MKSRDRRTVLWVSTLILASVAACKPASEPPRGGSEAPPEAQPPSTMQPPSALPPESSAWPEPPAVTDLEPARPADGRDAELIPGAAEPPEDPPVAVDPLEAALAVPAEASVAAARKRNTEGVRRHRLGDHAGAAEAYREALEVWPGHVLARFNLACALSLLGRTDDAIAELQALQALGARGVDLAGALERARTDPDLSALRDLPAFREITGFTSVTVAWLAGDEGSERSARAAAESLRALHWPVRLAIVDLPPPGLAGDRRAILEIDAGDPVAVRAAPRIAAGAAVEHTILVRAPADSASPARLTFAGATQESETKPNPYAEGLEARGDGPPEAAPLEDWLGPRLRASEGDRLHALQLKETGFFEWESVASDGQRVTRRGRYRVDGDRIHLDFRATHEGAAEGTVEVSEGNRSDHPLRVTADALFIGDLRFGR